MSKNIKVKSVELLSKNIVVFHRYWSGCQSHRIENGGKGWCRSIAYKVRPYWYKRIKSFPS